MKPEKHHLSLRFLATSLLLCGTVGAAQPVTITNAGFEQPVVASDGGVGTAPTGWPAFNGAIINTLNPSTSDLSAEAPEGANVGLVRSSAVEDGLSQILTSSFQADANYQLVAKVANTKFTAGFPGYRVQLVANGTVLAEDDNSQAVAEDTVVTSTVNYTYNAGLHAGLVGQALEIRLLSKGLAADEEVAFDDVQLSVALGNPLAAPGGPYTIPVGGSLSLNGSASLPSDGQNITTYEWDLDNDGDFSEAITGATPPAIAYADLQSTYNMIVGANTIKLRVTDSAAKSSTTEGSVTLLPVIPVGDRWWDGPNTGGVTDGASQGGSATWDTTTTNWDPGAGYAGPIPWINSNNDNAVFGGIGGIYTLAEAVNLKDLTFQDINANQTITGQTLNFASGAKITTLMNLFSREFTIESAITGKPEVMMVSSDQNKQLTFKPSAGAQALGVITNPYSDGGGDKARLNLDGSTTGNTIEGITYQKTGGNFWYGYLHKQGSGTWTINGNVEQGYIQPNAGTLIINGIFTSKYQGLYPVLAGARVGGSLNYLQTDSRFGHVRVNSGGIVAPGNPAVANGVGTINIEFGTGRAEIGRTIFNDGSIYEWQIGAANATDVVHIVRTATAANNNRSLTVGAMVLKVLDAGGTPSAGDQLPVFNYDASVDVTGVNLGAITIDTTALTGWSGTPTLGHDTINRIFYLTGLSKSGGGNTFATWIAGYTGVGAFTGVGDDADGDGIDNGVENFFGTDPSASNSGLVAGTVGVNTFTFTHPQNATPASDLTAAYQWSKDLATFYASGANDGSSTVTFTTQANTPVAGTTTVTATVTGTATSKLFVNIKVTQP